MTRKKEAAAPKLYTLQEVADILRINRWTLYGNIKRGKLHFNKYGSQYRVTEEELQHLIKNGFSTK